MHRIEPDSPLQFPPTKEYTCELCSWHKFESMYALDDHMKGHMSKSRMCEICGKTVTPGTVTSHLRTHMTANK